MKVLLVTPVTVGSGETITALHIAERIRERGGTILFLAAPFANGFLEEQFSGSIRNFTDDGAENRVIWESTIREFLPDAIVFSDYPLMFFSSGVSPMSDIEEWAHSLDGIDAHLVTLDHTGFAQREQSLFFGPPHLSFHYERLPSIPRRMQVLLPCPMNEPAELPGRAGHPFRYWDVPLTVPEDRRSEIRGRYLKDSDEYLIFHATARWAWETAQSFEIPYYQFLPRILEYYLADLAKPATIVSVNNGSLLDELDNPGLRIINSAPLPKSEYEALLFSSDLMLTENTISITLGKAICGRLPCAAFRNSRTFRALLDQMSGPLREVVKAMEEKRPGAVYPYDMFPGGTSEWLAQVGLYHRNSITRGFRALEVYGEEQTRCELRALLQDAASREALRANQEEYIDKLRALPDAYEVLRQVIFGRNAA
jgi:hypothetical protein